MQTYALGHVANHILLRGLTTLVARDRATEGRPHGVHLLEHLVEAGHPGGSLAARGPDRVDHVGRRLTRLATPQVLVLAHDDLVEGPRCDRPVFALILVSPITVDRGCTRG